MVDLEPGAEKKGIHLVMVHPSISGHTNILSNKKNEVPRKSGRNEMNLHVTVSQWQINIRLNGFPHHDVVGHFNAWCTIQQAYFASPHTHLATVYALQDTTMQIISVTPIKTLGYAGNAV